MRPGAAALALAAGPHFAGWTSPEVLSVALVSRALRAVVRLLLEVYRRRVAVQASSRRHAPGAEAGSGTQAGAA